MKNTNNLPAQKDKVKAEQWLRYSVQQGIAMQDTSSGSVSFGGMTNTNYIGTSDFGTYTDSPYAKASAYSTLQNDTGVFLGIVSKEFNRTPNSSDAYKSLLHEIEGENKQNALRIYKKISDISFDFKIMVADNSNDNTILSSLINKLFTKKSFEQEQRTYNNISRSLIGSNTRFFSVDEVAAFAPRFEELSKILKFFSGNGGDKNIGKQLLIEYGKE
jgi:hypothetical protein